MMVSKNVMWGLVALAAGAGLAAALMPSRRHPRRTQPADEHPDRVDLASDESFPASDPPSYSAPTVNPPGPVS